MDSLFFLNPEARLSFLQTETRTLGCSYICLWYYLPHPSNCLISMDGWYHEDEWQPSSSSGSLVKMLFEAYRGSFCSVESGCIPGLAFNQGLPYIQLEGSDLMNSASILAQQQFYKEAGIKKAVFMGCRRGEIELGISASSNKNLQASIQQLFSNDLINYQQSHAQFGERLLPDQYRLSPSSTSSTLQSISVGSPDSSSFILSNPAVTAPSASALSVPHQITMNTYSLYRNILLPSPHSDEAALTRAMLAVISSQQDHHPQLQPEENQMSQTSSTFELFRLTSAASFESMQSLDGQKIIKKSISILRKIYSRKYAEARRHEHRPVSSQLHHMIAERKRREKLNASYHALRMLLPPGSKKDKASVLSKTQDYLKTLKAQINELEEQNRRLESQLRSKQQSIAVADSNERVEVQVMRASESTSESQQIDLLLIVRVEVNLVDLLLRVLQCLKGMGVSNLVSIDASDNDPQENVFALARFTLQVEASDWDEDNLKETVTRVICDLERDTAASRLPHEK